MVDKAISALASIVSREEEVLWCGKPNKLCTILECIFNPLLIFAILWAFLDMKFMEQASQAHNYNEISSFFVPFIMIHLMPVWIYLYGAITSFLKCKNAAFIVTNRAVYISGGVIIKTQKMKTYDEIAQVDITKGIFDEILGVGDIYLAFVFEDAIYRRRSSRALGMRIYNIKDYQRAFTIIKEAQLLYKKASPKNIDIY